MRVDMSFINRPLSASQDFNMTIEKGQQLTQIQNEPKTDQNQNGDPSKKEIVQSIDTMNQVIEPKQTSIKFVLHEKLNKYYVQMIDKNTQVVIREIPPKKFLDMYADTLKQLGILADKKA